MRYFKRWNFRVEGQSGRSRSSVPTGGSNTCGGAERLPGRVAARYRHASRPQGRLAVSSTSRPRSVSSTTGATWATRPYRSEARRMGPHGGCVPNWMEDVWDGRTPAARDFNPVYPKVFRRAPRSTPGRCRARWRAKPGLRSISTHEGGDRLPRDRRVVAFRRPGSWERCSIRLTTPSSRWSSSTSVAMTASGTSPRAAPGSEPSTSRIAGMRRRSTRWPRSRRVRRSCSPTTTSSSISRRSNGSRRSSPGARPTSRCLGSCARDGAEEGRCWRSRLRHASCSNGDAPRHATRQRERPRGREVASAGHDEAIDTSTRVMVAMRADVLRSTPLPEEYFLYWEELEWFWHLRAAGRRVVIVPSAAVIHDGGRVDVRPEKSRLLARNAVRCVRRTQGRRRPWVLSWLSWAWNLRLVAVDVVRTACVPSDARRSRVRGDGRASAPRSRAGASCDERPAGRLARSRRHRPDDRGVGTRARRAGESVEVVTRPGRELGTVR